MDHSQKMAGLGCLAIFTFIGIIWLYVIVTGRGKNNGKPPKNWNDWR